MKENTPYIEFFRFKGHVYMVSTSRQLVGPRGLAGQMEEQYHETTEVSEILPHGLGEITKQPLGRLMYRVAIFVQPKGHKHMVKLRPAHVYLSDTMHLPAIAGQIAAPLERKILSRIKRAFPKCEIHGNPTPGAKPVLNIRLVDWNKAFAVHYAPTALTPQEQRAVLGKFPSLVRARLVGMRNRQNRRKLAKTAKSKHK